MKQNKQKTLSISLVDLWIAFTSHMLVIIVSAVAVFGVLFFYQISTYSAQYTSKASVYILRNGETSSSTPTTSDFSLALTTVEDITRTLKSHRVLDKVIDQLGMDISYEKLQSMIVIENPDSTRFLEISVTAPTPGDAKIIVDKLCEIGSNEIKYVMGVDQVNIVDPGTYSPTPSNSRVTYIPFVGGIDVAVLIYIIYFIIDSMNNKISTPDDVEGYIQLPVLGIIPYADNDGNEKSKYKGVYADNSHKGGV